MVLKTLVLSDAAMFRRVASMLFSSRLQVEVFVGRLSACVRDLLLILTHVGVMLLVNIIIIIMKSIAGHRPPHLNVTTKGLEPPSSTDILRLK